MDQISSYSHANERCKEQQQVQKSKKKLKNKKQTLNMKTSECVAIKSVSKEATTPKTLELNGLSTSANHHKHSTNGLNQSFSEQLHIEDEIKTSLRSLSPSLSSLSNLKLNGLVDHSDTTEKGNDQIYEINGYHDCNALKKLVKSKISNISSFDKNFKNKSDDDANSESLNQKVVNKTNKYKNKVDINHCHTEALNAVNSVVQALEQCPVLSVARDLALAKKCENGFLDANLKQFSFDASISEHIKTVTRQLKPKTVDNKTTQINKTELSLIYNGNARNDVNNDESVNNLLSKNGTNKSTREFLLKTANENIAYSKSAGNTKISAKSLSFDINDQTDGFIRNKSTVNLKTGSEDFFGACGVNLNNSDDHSDDIPTSSIASQFSILNTATQNTKAVANANTYENQDPSAKNEDSHAIALTPPFIGSQNVLNIEYKEYESELQMHDIMRLIQSELSEPYSIYTYRYFIYNWPKLCFLAAHGNKYVGAIVCKLDMHMNVRRGYIAMLAVRKDYRKLKIGTTLVQKAIEAMLADKADEVVLETEMRNLPALRLYENLGFVRDKRLFRYYLNGVDALRLKLWFR